MCATSALGSRCAVRVCLVAACLSLAACEDSELARLVEKATTAPGAQVAAPPADAAENAATDGPVPVAAQPNAVAAGATGNLGSTIASLGTPSEPGLWLKTPMVATQVAGVVRSRETGARVAVTLIPIDGPATAGSRVSLEAMRTLGLPLTALATLDVSVSG